MTYYPPTLLPSSPPYDCASTYVKVMVDRCMRFQDNICKPEIEKEQMFELTMAIIEFWDDEGKLGVL